jgi:hypothetical protein
MAMQLAALGQKLVTEPRVLPDEVFEDFTDRRSLGCDGGLAPGCGTEDGRKADVNWHWVLHAWDRKATPAT